MPDLRDDLRRLAQHMSEPASFDDLASARQRRDRRRHANALVVGLVVGLAVVVVAAVVLATTFGNRSGVGPAVAPSSWTTYTNPYGWTIAVPQEWRTDVIATPGGGIQGARFIGGDLSIEISTQTAAAGSPQPGLTMPPSSDSRFPLNADELLSPIEGGLGGSFFGDGLRFEVLVLTPSLPDFSLSRVDADILDRMIGSISFRPWTQGELRHGWTAIQTPTQDVSWITIRGGLYILFRTADGYRLVGSISCAGEPPSRTSATADGFAVLDCPDGSSWQMDAAGSSGGSFEAAANDPPPDWVVTTAHDGTLIAYVIPGDFPPGTGGSPSASPTP